MRFNFFWNSVEFRPSLGIVSVQCLHLKTATEGLFMFSVLFEIQTVISPGAGTVARIRCQTVVIFCLFF